MNKLLEGILYVLSIGVFAEALSMESVKRQYKIFVQHVNKKLVKQGKEEKTIISAPALDTNVFYAPLHSLICQENATVDQVEFLLKQDNLTIKQREAAYSVTRRYIGESPSSNWKGNHCGNKEVVNYLFNEILIQKLNRVIRDREMAEDFAKAKLRA